MSLMRQVSSVDDGPMTPPGTPPRFVPNAPRKRVRREMKSKLEMPLPLDLNEAFDNGRSAPEKVEPDMMWGLESISCELAGAFYIQYRNKLIHMESRREVQGLYMKTYKSWCPTHLVSAPRHVSQVMYAMANYLRVCSIRGGKIVWYTMPLLPPAPVNCANQLALIENVTMTRGDYVPMEVDCGDSMERQGTPMDIEELIYEPNMTRMEIDELEI
jgi:hypothetical protein